MARRLGDSFWGDLYDLVRAVARAIGPLRRCERGERGEGRDGNNEMSEHGDFPLSSGVLG